MAQAKKNSDFQFEKALADLNGLVSQMESGKLSLEDSLNHFEKGIALIRQCQHALSEAEQKVHILTKEDTLKPFDEASS